MHENPFSSFYYGLETRDLKEENRKLLDKISTLNESNKELASQLKAIESELDFYLEVFPRFLNGLNIDSSEIRTQGDLINVLKKHTEEFNHLKSLNSEVEENYIAEPEDVPRPLDTSNPSEAPTNGWVEFKDDCEDKCENKCDKESKTFLTDTIKSLQERVAAIENKSRESRMDGVPLYASAGFSGRPEFGNKISPQDYRPGVNNPLLNGLREMLSETFRYIDPKLLDQMIQDWSTSTSKSK